LSMEATSSQVTPLNDQDKQVLDIMERLGWGLTVPRIAEAAILSEVEVQSSLDWLHRHGKVEPRINDKHGCTYWYTKKATRDSMESPVCSICGKRFKNVQGLAIHQARAHGISRVDKVAEKFIWKSDSVHDQEQEASDSMTMDVDPKTISFVHEIIDRFSTLPGAKISVTVEFSKEVDA